MSLFEMILCFIIFLLILYIVFISKKCYEIEDNFEKLRGEFEEKLVLKDQIISGLQSEVYNLNQYRIRDKQFIEQLRSQAINHSTLKEKARKKVIFLENKVSNLNQKLSEMTVLKTMTKEDLEEDFKKRMNL